MYSTINDHDHLDPRLRIVNVVLTADVGNRLECSTLAKHLRNAEYNPKRFAALKHRIRHHGCAPTFLIFPSGKFVCAGAPSITIARRAFERLFVYLQRFQHLERTNDITVQNVVAHGTLGKRLCLPHLATRFRQQATYEAELFPALKLELSVQHKIVTANLFSSGKFVLTGTTTCQALNEACAQLFQLL